MGRRIQLKPGIGGKLFLAFLSMAILVGVLTVASGRQTAELEGSLQRFTEELIPILTDVEALSRAVMELSSEALNAAEKSIPQGNEAAQARIRDHRETVVIAAEGMMSGTVTSLNLLLNDRYRPEWTIAIEKVEILRKIASQFLKANSAPDNVEEIESLEKAEDEAIQALDNIRLLTVKELHERHTEAEAIQRQSVITQRMALVIAILLSVLLSMVLTNWFLTPLAALANATREISAGSFNVRVAIAGDDELSQLGQAFNRMAERLQTTTVSKSKVDTIFSTMTECLCVIDPELRILESMEKLWPELNTFVKSTLFAKVPSQEAVRKELTLGEDAGRRLFQVTVMQVPELPEVGSAGLIVAQDITLARRAELELGQFREKMVHAEQLASLGSVAAILSHKLNQPLTVLRLLVQQMLRNLHDEAVLQTKLSFALEEIDIVRTQIREVLQYSRPIDSQGKTRIELSQIVRKISELFSRSYEEQNIAFRMEGFEELPAVLASQDQIEEAVYIVLENAQHACVGISPALIRVEASLKEDRVVLGFSDSGQGIPKEIQARVFEPFFTTKPATHGTGLGLARLKQIITAHDGDVWLESEERKGTTVFFSLPVAKS